MITPKQPGSRRCTATPTDPLEPGGAGRASPVRGPGRPRPDLSVAYSLSKATTEPSSGPILEPREPPRLGRRRAGTREDPPECRERIDTRTIWQLSRRAESRPRPSPDTWRRSPVACRRTVAVHSDWSAGWRAWPTSPIFERRPFFRATSTGSIHSFRIGGDFRTMRGSQGEAWGCAGVAT